MTYVSSPEFQAGDAERIGVLLVNSGTPASPEPRDVRKFLEGLLTDRRVVELPRLFWYPILYGLILPLRPRRIAKKYRHIWTDRGSPLIALSERLRTELMGTLSQRALAPLSIELGMLYSPPSIREALDRLRNSGAQRILVVPMFPQYSGATTGAVYDQVNFELRRWRWLPELRFIAGYDEQPGYIDALRASVVSHWEQHGRTKHLVVSFHGIPEAYAHAGDPYFHKCKHTARLLADELLLGENQWTVSFQSRFGPGNWLKPYTIELMGQLPARGIDEVTVVCPGFAVDCLETIEEIEIENRQAFAAAGGRNFQYVPALNARPEHARFLADLIAQHCQGWTHVDRFLAPAGAARGTSA
jgi:protoporphyrin/coproporphyrin ferrochelatase